MDLYRALSWTHL